MTVDEARAVWQKALDRWEEADEIAKIAAAKMAIAEARCEALKREAHEAANVWVAICKAGDGE